MKTPQALGMPAKFTEWRGGQYPLIRKIQKCEREAKDGKSVVAVCSPTGSGKSLTVMTVAATAGDRTLIGTTDRGLQQQLVDDFKELGLVKLEGKGNYPCPFEEDFTCAQGILAKCPLSRSRDCSYHNAWIKASRAQYVVSNYSNIISVNRYTKGIGKFERFIADEAHQAPAHVGNAIKVTMSYYDIGGIIQRESPQTDKSVEVWKDWAKNQLTYAQLLLDQSQISLERSPSKYEINRHWAIQGVQRKLSMLSRINPVDWICKAGEFGYEFDAVNPARYARKFLFKEIDRVLLASGTLRPKTLKQLGFKTGMYSFVDHPATFDPARFKIYLVPSMKIDRHTDKVEDLGVWLLRMSQIIEPRQDRKGIIHCGSFERQQIIVDHFERRYKLMFNKRGEPTADAVKRFKLAPAGTIFVSPSIPMGYDFIGDYCEYQIIAKVPFDNPQDKLVKARTAIDREYGIHEAVQRVEQMIGRGMRSRSDSCENFLLDENFLWVIAHYKHLFSPFFWKYYVQTPRLPKPLPKLIVGAA